LRQARRAGLEVPLLGQAGGAARRGPVAGASRIDVAGHLEEVSSDRVETVVSGHPVVGLEAGEHVEARLGSPDHRDRDRPIQRRDRARRQVIEQLVQGYRGVAPHLQAHPGSDVLVAIHGTPSIGLYAAQCALALGAGSVTVTSDDDRVLELGAALGAQTVRTDFARRADRYPIVVDWGPRERGLLFAIASTRPEGICQSVSLYPSAGKPLPLGRMYTLGLKLFMGRAHSVALIPEVLALIEAGRLQPELVTTTVVDWADAPTAYLDDTIKLVVRRD
jgi:hypothetical protein